MHIFERFYLFKLIHLIVMCILFQTSTGSNLVNTTHGAVRGMWEYVQGTKVYKYLAIPYAEPPVGEYRFRDPIPAQPWKAVRNTIR